MMKKRLTFVIILSAFCLAASLLLSACDGGVRTFTKDLAQDAQDYREAIGYKEGVKNEDGSVSYVFEKQELKDLKERYEADVQKKADEITKGKNKIESIKVIIFAKDYKQIDVYVDENVYSLFDAAYVLPFLRTAAFMQVLNGANAFKVDAEMNIVNVNTKERLSTTTYQRIFGEEE